MPPMRSPSLSFRSLTCFVSPARFRWLYIGARNLRCTSVWLVATCALTAAGFGRFPERILPHYLFYAGVDLLVLLGVARDLIFNRTVHRVYLFVLPPFILGQTLVTYIAFHNVPFWLR